MLQDEVFCICHLHLCQLGLKRWGFEACHDTKQLFGFSVGVCFSWGWMSCRGPFQPHQVNDSARCRSEQGFTEQEEAALVSSAFSQGETLVAIPRGKEADGWLLLRNVIIVCRTCLVAFLCSVLHCSVLCLYLMPE